MVKGDACRGEFFVKRWVDGLVGGDEWVVVGCGWVAAVVGGCLIGGDGEVGGLM